MNNDDGDKVTIDESNLGYVEKKIGGLKAALQFIADITFEELQYAPAGSGAEVALRLTNRKANETLRATA